MNSTYLLDKKTIGKVKGVDEVLKVGYLNEEKTDIAFWVGKDTGFSQRIINIHTLAYECKEYLIRHKNINIITDYSREETIEERWTAMAIEKGEIARSYVFIDDVEILLEYNAYTENEAIFKITDKLLSNDKGER